MVNNTLSETAKFVAARLTVIISQSAPGHSRASDAEESLLTELMMTPGLDATLVGSLDGVQIDSTDYLCLSSFTQNLALVTTLTVAEVAQHWERLGLDGHIIPVGHTNGSPARRVYYLSLELGTAKILAQLKQLLIDRSVQTVSLSLPVMAKPNVPTDSHAPLAATIRKTTGSPANVAQELLPNMLQSSEQSQTGDIGVPDSETTDTQWPDLERLVDDFDALDL